MPELDVSDILDDIDFVQLGLICNRTTQVVGQNGRAVNTAVATRFAGVVTQLSGSQLKRKAEGEYISGSILIITRFRLQDGKTGRTADTVERDGRTYTVSDVDNYSTYGAGFVEAVCELLPLRPLKD
jgi:hypothetical protein